MGRSIGCRQENQHVPENLSALHFIEFFTWTQMAMEWQSALLSMVPNCESHHFSILPIFLLNSHNKIRDFNLVQKDVHRQINHLSITSVSSDNFQNVLGSVFQASWLLEVLSPLSLEYVLSSLNTSSSLNHYIFMKAFLRLSGKLQSNTSFFHIYQIVSSECNLLVCLLPVRYLLAGNHLSYLCLTCIEHQIKGSVNQD